MKCEGNKPRLKGEERPPSRVCGRNHLNRHISLAYRLSLLFLCAFLFFFWYRIYLLLFAEIIDRVLNSVLSHIPQPMRTNIPWIGPTIRMETAYSCPAQISPRRFQLVYTSTLSLLVALGVVRPVDCSLVSRPVRQISPQPIWSRPTGRDFLLLLGHTAALLPSSPSRVQVATIVNLFLLLTILYEVDSC